MPCINFLTEILPGPALAVLAFRPAASNSHNAAGFKSLRNTKQLVLLPSTQKLFLNLKQSDFSNENPLILGVSGGRNTAIHARSAEVSDRPNNNE